MEITRAFKGVWIPKELWNNRELSIQEKCFLIEIESLDNEKGCFAGNEYFSEHFNISKSRCTQVIKSLEKKGFIESTLSNKKGSITVRILKVSSRFRKLNPTVQYSKSHGLGNAEYNNTSNNNTNNKVINVNTSLFEEEKKTPAKTDSIDFEALINYYNSLTGKRTRKIDDKVKTKFKSLIKEGYSKVDIKKAIFNGSKDEYHVGNNYKYFNLELVSRDLTHFERFLNMIPKKTDKEIKNQGGHINY